MLHSAVVKFLPTVLESVENLLKGKRLPALSVKGLVEIDPRERFLCLKVGAQ